MLDDKRYQLVVLQSFGCIVQIVMLVFEIREIEIVEFIRSKIFKSESVWIINVLYFVKVYLLFVVNLFFSFFFYLLEEI